MTSRIDRQPAHSAMTKRRFQPSRRSGFGGTLLGLFIGIAVGLALAAGVAFYLWKGRPYTHAIWHVFVFTGVACHFVAVLSIIGG